MTGLLIPGFCHDQYPHRLGSHTKTAWHNDKMYMRWVGKKTGSNGHTSRTAFCSRFGWLNVSNLATLPNCKAISTALRNGSNHGSDFNRSLPRRKMSPGSIHLKPEDSDRLLEVLRPSVLQMILLTTVSLTEGILCDLLATAGDGLERPTTLRQALDRLSKKLKNNGRHADNGWAVQAMHEARILRNCIAHGSGVWSGEAVKQFNEQFENAQLKPISGEAFTISVDDIFAYRRAAKTVLNEAAHLLRATKTPPALRSSPKNKGRRS